MPTRRALDPYAILGLSRDASPLQVARAHRNLAKRHHPDLHEGASDAAERMRRINEAWRILSDPARRARYDADRAAAHWPGPGFRTAAGADPWASTTYGPRPGATTWTTWPESRQAAAPRSRRPARPEPVAPSFGDRPAVIVAIWVTLSLLFFLGTWFGSLAP
jgi:curved DNA-binding protein CbpA